MNINKLMKSVMQDGYAPIHVHDDFNASDHPQAPAGSNKGGQFVKKGDYTLASASAGKNAVIRQAHKIAKSTTLKLEAKALKLQDLAAAQKAPIVASYANQLLGELEKEHGLNKGELGKAVPKKDDTKAETPATTAPAPAKPATVGNGDIPKPTNEESMQFWLYTVATNEHTSLAHKISNISQEINNFTPEDVEYGNKVLAILKKSDGWNKPEADLAPPYPGSDNQSAIYKAAQAGKTKVEQIANVKKAIGALPVGADFATEYGNKILKALGEAPSASKTAPAPQAAPAPKTAPKSKNEVVSKRPSTAKFLSQYESATSVPEKASDTHSSSFWQNDVSYNQRVSVKKYTSNGYSAMNKALRDLEHASPKVIEDINNIEEAFEHDQAVLKSDLKLARGMQSYPQDKIDKMLQSLEKGFPTRMSFDGFISTGYGEDTPFSGKIKMKILARKGTRALSVQHISSHPSENEVMLRHGQNFEVLKVAKSENGVTTIHLVTV